MEYAQVIEHLEIALIELEYASADFSQRKDAARELPKLQDLESVRSKIRAANQAMQIALAVLGERIGHPGTAAA